jgi:hypothetical protein
MATTETNLHCRVHRRAHEHQSANKHADLQQQRVEICYKQTESARFLSTVSWFFSGGNWCIVGLDRSC